MDTPVKTPDSPQPPESSEKRRGRSLHVALAGNPNVGKTTLFNALTGLRQKVANYPGVTVEKKTGKLDLSEVSRDYADAQLVDLPGTYSLASRSPDEHVARQVLLGQITGTPRPDVIIVLADASNLERNLYLVTQVLELGRPAIVALSMMDIAEQQGKHVDVEKLSRHLRVPVIPIQAHRGKEDPGIKALKAAVVQAAKHIDTSSDIHALSLPLPDIMETHIDRLKKILAEEGLSSPDQAYFDAHLMLSAAEEESPGDVDMPDTRLAHPKVRAELAAALDACHKADVDPIGAEVETHYTFISQVVADCLREQAAAGGAPTMSRTDKIDRIVTHKTLGMALFIGIMGLIFWAIFSLAAPVMDFFNEGIMGGLGKFIAARMTDGPLKSLLVDGVIAGVGNVVVFLPQIAMLFFFLAVLEDSGYMSRAAFLMDRFMSRVGLHGKSFIPLLSGYACAVPAIMGTRVIENRRDRLATILILPLMSCSARLPVYTLMIGLFWAGQPFKAAMVMLSMYLLGTFSAFGMAWIFKRTLLKGPAPAFILEMPPYRMPKWKVVFTTVAQRSWAFLKRAGTVIFVFSVIMWAGTHYPKPSAYSKNYDSLISEIDAQIEPIKEKAEHYGNLPKPSGVLGDNAPAIPEYVTQYEKLNAQRDDLVNAQAHEILENSIAGRVGRFIAPVFYPLGFDWKASIGVTGAFFAREVVVSTMGITYSVGEADEKSSALKEAMTKDTWPEGTSRAGQLVWTKLVAVSLMVFVVFCMQCLSTLAIARKETGNWGWPAFMFVYMTALAWVAAFIVYQGGTLLGIA